MISLSDSFWSYLDQPLQGKNIILEPLHKDHHAALMAIAKDPAIWTYLSADTFEKWFSHAIEEKHQRQRCPYVVRAIGDKQIIGSTSYYDLSEKHRRCNIGYTWYHPSVWGTKINPDCKLALLTHGFEIMKFNRIAFKIDLRNIRSQRAVEKLGAVREGIFRKHMVLSDGNTRDTVYYSIVNDEWPQVKEGLEKRLI